MEKTEPFDVREPLILLSPGRNHRSGVDPYEAARFAWTIDGDTASRLRIGVASGGLARRLHSRRLDPGAARRVGLLAGDRDALSGRIVVPDRDASGRTTWLTARSLDDREPRYLNLSLPSPLLGLARYGRREPGPELGSRRDGRRAFLRSLQQAHAREQESWMRSRDHGRRGRAA